MNDQTQNDHEHMRQYLLGLDTAGLEDFENRMFADDALYLALQEEQDALIDDFLSEQLTTDEDRRFREQCDLSPTLRHKVAEFRDLRSALEKRRAAAHSKAAAQFPRWLWWLTPAVACVCLLCVFLILHRGRGAVTPQQAQSTKQETKPNVPTQAAAVFFIPYGVTRGSSDLPVLNIPLSASVVHLQLELNKTASLGSHWKIELRRGTDVQLLADEASAQRIGAETFIVAHLTAASLSDGIYTAHLTPTASGQPSLTRSFLVKHIRVP
jgi:hypothetical protein